MNVVAKRPEQSEVIENVLVNGDLKQLSPEQRVQYYDRVCKSLGLNPLTKPFDYLSLNGKMVLYAKRDCTDQLRSIHKISVTDMSDTERDGVCIVTVKVQNGEGRTDISKGAVSVNGLKGDALANAILKCETKAKRRATLSICGLGFLDELEVETIPQQARRTSDDAGQHESLQIPAKRKSSAQSKRDGDWDKFQRALLDCQSAREVERLHEEYRKDVYPTWKQDWQDVAEEDFQKRLVMFSASDLKQTLQDSVEEVEEKDNPTPHQVMVYDECVAWIGGATSYDDYLSRLKNKGLINGSKDLTVFQRNKLRDYCKEVEGRVRG